MEIFYLNLLEELASQGNEEAMLELVQHYLFAENISKSKTQQVKNFLNFLAEKQNTQAMLLLGGQYYEGTRFFRQNFKEAVKWYLKTGDQLDHTGLCYLGYCYFYGRGIPIDMEQAFNCFSNSAYKGNPNAMYKLGDMYMDGLFVKKNKDTAFCWYNEAWIKVNEDDTYVRCSIAYRLGKCFSHGYGIEENLPEALHLLQYAELGFLLLVVEDEPYAREVLFKIKHELEEIRKKIYEII